MKRVICAVAVVAGCAGPQDVETEAEAVVAENPTLNMCLSDDLRALVGQDEAAARAAVPPLHRIILPNSLITQEYQPRRINVDLDEAANVTRVWCG